MNTLDSKTLKKFLNQATTKLSGEWLLVGGTLLPAIGLDVRATTDIDIVSLEKSGNSSALELMKIADSLGLPVDTINQSATFFVNRTKIGKNDLIVLLQKGKTTIYRPSLSLYWKLKIPRLTEADATDCFHYLVYCKRHDSLGNLNSLKSFVKSEIKTCENSSRLERLQELLNLLSQ